VTSRLVLTFHCRKQFIPGCVLTKGYENMREAKKSAKAHHLLAIPECLSMMREILHKEAEG
jgi:hypothetical protein